MVSFIGVDRPVGSGGAVGVTGVSEARTVEGAEGGGVGGEGEAPTDSETGGGEVSINVTALAPTGGS